MPGRNEPFLAFACLLLALVTGSLLVQTAGWWLGISLAHYALLLVLFPCLWLTYIYFFPPSHRNVAIGLMLAAILAIAGIASSHILDLSEDGMSYHLPAVAAMLDGWNPISTPSLHRYHNSFPFGAWAVEASLAALYRSTESAKILQVWWLFIALPILLGGMRTQFGRLQPCHYMLAWLLVLNPVVIMQSMTHYVDSLLYLEGLAFIGALMMYQGTSGRSDQLARVLMAATLLLVISTKLSGPYWGIALCAGTVSYIFFQKRSRFWNTTFFLFATGTVCTLLLCYHPYITNLLHYGGLLPWPDYRNLESELRPPNLTALSDAGRFFYSIFSTQSGTVGEPAMLKWPWVTTGMEMRISHPSILTSAFGVFFTLGTVLSIAFFCFSCIHGWLRNIHKGLASFALVLLVASMFFPEGWWARFVPFAYAVPLLLLLASRPRAALYLVLAVFAANSAIAIGALSIEQYRAQASYHRRIALMQTMPDKLYLVPRAGPVYTFRNHAYLTIQRRMQAYGIETPVRVDAPCPHQLQNLSGFRVCYE